MKILFINISDTLGGSAIIAYQLGKVLKEKYNTQNLFLVRSKYSDDKKVVQTRNSKFEAKIEWATNIFFNLLGLQYKWLPFSPKKILNTAYIFKPDIISLHNTIGGYFRVNDLIELSSVAPIIWTMHDMWPITANASHTYGDESWKEMKAGKGESQIFPWIGLPTGSWLLKQKKKIYSKANLRFVAPSNWMFNLAKESSLLINKKIDLIHHGIDLEQFKPTESLEIRKELNIPANAKVIMYSAHKAKAKAGDELEKILSILTNKYEKDLYLIILGEGKLKWLNDIKYQKIKTLQMGYVQNQNKIREYYSASDVFIHPTQADSFGLVLLESIACGTPCITFAIGGCTDIIVNAVSGYVISPFNSEEFAGKIIEVLTNQNLLQSLKSSSRKYAEDNFSISKMAEKYKELFLNEMKILNQGFLITD